MAFVRTFQNLGLRVLGGGDRAGAERARASESATVAPQPGLLQKLRLPVLVIATQALVATVSLHSLSMLRVFIECESVWSKSQKNAFNYLNQYLDQGDEEDYRRFQAAVAEDFDHNHARQALERPAPDVAVAAPLFRINLSGQSLGDPAFIDFVRARFAAHAIAPASIAFEITETAAIANLEEAVKFIDTFRAIGCTFALDDFGAGMSSFGYLKRLPVDYLKIDGGFVKDMLKDRMDRAMVDMIARMARTLGIKTIAEFAESAEIVEALRALGVDYAQGFAVSEPAPICGAFGCALACEAATGGGDVETARCA